MWTERFLRLNEVMKMTGLCRSAVYAKEGFPKPLKLHGRASAWIESEVVDWMQSVIKMNRPGFAPAV